MAPWLQWYLRSLFGWAVFVLVAPILGWILASDLIRWMWNLPGWLALAVLLARRVRGGLRETRLVGVGGAAVILAGGIEWSFHLLLWGSAMPWTLWAFGLFAATMALSLAQRFERAHGELDGLRYQLEQMVSDRSSELSVANSRLKSEIAERRLAEEAMRMLERAVEQSIDGIVVTDLEGRVQFANEAWAHMHGEEVTQSLGRHWRRFHSPQQFKEELEPALEKVLEEGAFDGEVGHRRRNGTEFPTWTSITLLKDPEDGQVGFVVVGRDITGRRLAEEERDRLKSKVQESKKLKSLGDLAAGIAHDYNNLLTGVLGNVDLLLRVLPQGSAAHEKIHHIEEAAERVVDLTSHLLTYAGEDAVVMEPLDLNSLLVEAEPQLSRLVMPAGRLELDLSQGLPTIQGDSAQLLRMVRNLVSNGAAALSEGGSVVVRTEGVELSREELVSSYLEEGHAPGSYVRLAVVDTGQGIDETTRRRMFDPFFSTRPSARGLGLATVLGAVRVHRGVIRVDSVPGRGSIFEVLLPVGVAVLASRGRGRALPGGVARIGNHPGGRRRSGDAGSLRKHSRAAWFPGDHSVRWGGGGGALPSASGHHRLGVARPHHAGHGRQTGVAGDPHSQRPGQSAVDEWVQAQRSSSRSRRRGACGLSSEAVPTR